MKEERREERIESDIGGGSKIEGERERKKKTSERKKEIEKRKRRRE